MRKILVLLIAGLCMLPDGWAQQGVDEPISTDRPSIGSAPDLVPAHRIVVENGIGWSVGQRTLVVDWPETLLRVGFTRNIELRSMLPNLQHARGEDAWQQEDVSVGAKVHLPSSENWPVGTILSLSAPTGSSGVTSGGWDPSALVTTSHAWSSHLGSFASEDTTWAGNGRSGRWTEAQMAFDALWNTSSTVTNFIEWAPLLSTQFQGSGYTVDTGVLWILHRFIQIDVHGGRTWTGKDVTTVAGLGYSFSVPCGLASW